MELSHTGKKYHLSVILMIALSMLVVGLIFYVVGSNQKLFDHKYSLYMYQNNIEGLNPGAFVTLSGLKVGVVGKIEFTRVPNGDLGVKIQLKVGRKFMDNINKSSKAVIKTMGILGDKYVDLSLGKPGFDELQEGDIIDSEPAVNSNELMSDINEVIKDLKVTLSNSREISGKLKEGKSTAARILSEEKMGTELALAIKDLRLTLQKIRSGKGTIGKMVTDTTVYASLKNSSRSIEQISGQIAAGKGTIGKMVKDEKFYATVKSATTKADSVLTLLQGEGSAGRFLRDKKLYEEVSHLAKTLSFLSDDIKKNPKKYFTLKVF